MKLTRWFWRKWKWKEFTDVQPDRQTDGEKAIRKLTRVFRTVELKGDDRIANYNIWTIPRILRETCVWRESEQGMTCITKHYNEGVIKILLFER